MTRFDFTTPIDRRGSGAIKYGPHPKFPDADVLPFWVADMDFAVAPAIRDALQAKLDHGVFGYEGISDAYRDAVTGWLSRRFGWQPDPKGLITTPGIVFAVATAIRAFTNPEEAVLIQNPVYFPFVGLVKKNGRRLVETTLALKDGHYEIDFAEFERQIAENDVKLFVLCSPHNPTGRVWTRDELDRMAAICAAHRVIVFSDEIHCDFVWPGRRHTPFASLSPEAAAIAVVGTAPSKTFNLAGLQGSNLFIVDASLRRRYRNALTAQGFGAPNNLAMAATVAAYNAGEPWLTGLLAHLAGNIAVLREALADTPIRLIAPEGTYLMWLDCRALGLADDALEAFFVEDAGLWLNAGITFGSAGSGFMRMNLACPRATLDTGIARLEAALAQRGK
jgi:cystathionine beta-lyase